MYSVSSTGSFSFCPHSISDSRMARRLRTEMSSDTRRCRISAIFWIGSTRVDSLTRSGKRPSMALSRKRVSWMPMKSAEYFLSTKARW
ncbi:hypothetical protein D3C79_1011700 [compost metagenome]